MLHLSRLLEIFKTFLIQADPPVTKAVLYRDAVSVDTGSRRFFLFGICLEDAIFGYRGCKRHIAPM